MSRAQHTRIASHGGKEPAIARRGSASRKSERATTDSPRTLRATGPATDPQRRARRGIPDRRLSSGARRLSPLRLVRTAATQRGQHHEAGRGGHCHSPATRFATGAQGRTLADPEIRGSPRRLPASRARTRPQDRRRARRWARRLGRRSVTVLAPPDLAGGPWGAARNCSPLSCCCPLSSGVRLGVAVKDRPTLLRMRNT